MTFNLIYYNIMNNTETINTDIFNKLSSINNENNNEKIIFLVDISGSTTNVYNYHKLSENIYNSISKLNHIIVGWDTKYRILSDTEYLDIVSKKKGFNGTHTSAMAQYLSTLNGQNLNLVILTDGEVVISDITLCDSIMSQVIKNNNILSVNAFICAGYSVVNCSVLAPFLRGEWTSNVYKDTDNKLTSIHNIDNKERIYLLNLVKTANTEDEINNIYERLVTLLTAMTMGKKTGDPTMRALILEMFKRIKNNIKIKLSNNNLIKNIESEFFETKNLKINSVNELITWYNNSFKGDEFQAKIDFLLNMCDGQLSHMFNPADIRAAALSRSTTYTNKQTDDKLCEINNIPSSVSPIECPIMLDKTQNMVIMITDLPPLFNEIDKSMQDSIINNTFSAISLSDKIKQRLDHCISLEAYLGLKTNISPITRKNILNCIVLGADPISVKATNYALGKMILGKSGIIGNPDIWFYVVYHVIKNNVPWLEQILPMMENQLRYRMTHSNSTISMSGLPTHIQLRTKFGVSLRFVLSQIELKMKKDVSSFPIFAGLSHHIIYLLELFGCTIPESIKKYCIITNNLSKLVKECKVLHIDAFSTKYRSLIHNFYHITKDKLSDKIYYDSVNNGWFFEYIPLDGIQKNKPDFVKDMTEETINIIYNLSCLIDNENTSAFSILDNKVDIDNIDELYKVPIVQPDDWLLYTHPIKLPSVTIHPETMRPVTIKDGIHWKKSFVEFYNSDNHFTKTIFDNEQERPSGDVFSGCSLYCEFVETYRLHPTIDDFILYCFKKCKNSQYKHKTLPCIEFCVDIISDYNFARNIDIDTFLKKYEASRDRNIRIEIEKKYMN